MTDLAQLLPPNASALERHLVRIAQRADLDTASDAPANLFTTLPLSFQPWLAAEWQLAQFSLHFNSYHELISAGLPWLLERGSVASVVRALAWLAYEQVTLEEDEFLLHIDPGSTDAALDLARIRQVVAASLPAHSRLYRLHHGLDLRAARLDDSRLDDSLLDDDSGIWSGDPGSATTDRIKLSFGASRTFIVEAAPVLAPLAFHQPRCLTTVIDDALMQFDSWTLDSDIRLNSLVSISDLSTGLAGQPALSPVVSHHHATACTAIAALDRLAPITAIAPAAYIGSTARALPVYSWADQWRNGWTVCYPLIALPPHSPSGN